MTPLAHTPSTPRHPVRIGLLGLWTIFIFYMTLASAPPQSEIAGWLGKLLAAIGVSKWAMAKCFHFVAYGIWVWLLMGTIANGYLRPVTRAQLAICLGLLMTLSATQEGLQFLNPKRHPSIFDVFLNVVGGATFLLLRAPARMLLATTNNH